MNESSNKEKGFALVTVLMLLVLLLVLSAGILMSSYIGIQRSSVFQEGNISYINALSGSNMVIAFFERLHNPPDWTTPTGDLGDVLSHFPSQLKADYDIEHNTLNGSYTAGMFRVISAERIGGIPNDLPQDFEVVIAGFTYDAGNPVNESRVRLRLRIAPEIEFAYFMQDFQSNAQWVSHLDGIDEPTTRFFGRVHSNSSVTVAAHGGHHILDPKYPVFNDWGDMGHASILSVYRDANPHPFTFHGSGLADWDSDPQYYPFIWGDDQNPNKGWYGIAGAVDHENEVTYGGFGGSPREIDTDADYIPFPDLNPDLRSLMWNGNPNSNVPNAPAGASPNRVRIPDSTRPDGDIFIYGDASINFQSIYNTDNMSGHPIYNNRLIIEQPQTNNASNILRWEINIYRNSEGIIQNMTKEYFINGVQQPLNSDGDMIEEYSGIAGREQMGIYVDGNLGWAARGEHDNVALQDYSNSGISNWLEDKHLEDAWDGGRYLRGLSGESFGMFTIVASYDVLLTDDLIYADYEVPTDLNDYTADSFNNILSMNGIIARNVYVVPRPTASNNFDPFEINATVFATGLRLNANNINPDRRQAGVFGNAIYYRYIGDPGTQQNRPGYRNGNWDNLIHGIMTLKGAVINYSMGVFTIRTVNAQDGMYERYYFDKRLSIVRPNYMPGTNQGTIAFELLRMQEV